MSRHAPAIQIWHLQFTLVLPSLHWLTDVVSIIETNS